MPIKFRLFRGGYFGFLGGGSADFIMGARIFLSCANSGGFGLAEI